MADIEVSVPWKKSYYLRPGYLLPCIMARETVEKSIKNLEIRDDDIMVLCYPKAGTSWICEIVDAILHADDLRYLTTLPFHKKTPNLEFGPATHPDLQDLGLNIPLSNIDAYIKDMPSPRKLQTHVYPQDMPTQYHQIKPKTIFLTRNPKDVLVSLYGWHHATHFFTPVPWNELFEDFLKGNTIYGCYFEYHRQWAKYREEPWFHWTSYEELKADPHTTIRRMAEFMDRPLTDKQLEDIIHETSFETMKERNKNVPGRDLILRKDGNWQRKGITGDWKNYFTVAQNEIFNTHYAAKMKGMENLNLMSS